MTSIQSGMGIGEPASQGRLFSDPTVTNKTPWPGTEALRGSQSRRKEIEGGQLDMTEDDLRQRYTQEQIDFLKRGKVDDRYTKDLEDMLRRIVEAYNQWFGGEDHELITEAKALLERTGYTEDF